MYFRSTKKSAQDISMNEPIDSGKDGTALTLMDVLAGDDNIFDNLDHKIKCEQLYRHISRLSPREQTIIRLRYGLSGTRPRTQREVAQVLGISRSYVSRIEKKALENLHRQFEK
jgi:RNA polymerase sporulation-specific sigma factor